jgi:hypothetical protein
MLVNGDDEPPGMAWAVYVESQIPKRIESNFDLNKNGIESHNL